MCTVEHFTILKDIVLSLSAAITAFVAYTGIEKWKKELTGKANFETARLLIKATYILRDKVESCRSQFISGNEFPETYNLLTTPTPQEEGEAYTYLYNKRWSPVSKAVQEFDTCALEAEALWGKNSKEQTDKLHQCIRELQVSIDAVISDKYSGGEDFRDLDFRREMRANVSEIKKNENPLTIKIKLAIENIETVIRPYLNRN